MGSSTYFLSKFVSQLLFFGAQQNTGKIGNGLNVLTLKVHLQELEENHNDAK